MPYSHNRSEEKKKERKQKSKSFIERRKEKDAARGIVKDLCHRDFITGEIVYSHSKDPQIRKAFEEGVF